jgi:hypothetical protein
MAGKVFVAFTENDDNYNDFHGVFSTGKKAKLIFGRQSWKRVNRRDGSWFYIAYGEQCSYVVSKLKIDEAIGYLA